MTDIFSGYVQMPTDRSYSSAAGAGTNHRGGEQQQ